MPTTTCSHGRIHMDGQHWLCMPETILLQTSFSSLGYSTLHRAHVPLVVWTLEYHTHHPHAFLMACCARVWDLASGQCSSILQGHSCHVSSVAISQDGKTIVSGSNDTTIRCAEGFLARRTPPLVGKSVRSSLLNANLFRAIGTSCGSVFQICVMETGTTGSVS